MLYCLITDLDILKTSSMVPLCRMGRLLDFLERIPLYRKLSTMTQPSTLTAGTILLVENEALLLKFIGIVLKRAGFEVLSASTAEDAVQISEAFAGPIHLLLTGVSMPRVSGPELATIREMRPELRVMLISSDPEVRTLAAGHGWYFLETPFTASTLIATIQGALVPRLEYA